MKKLFIPIIVLICFISCNEVGITEPHKCPEIVPLTETFLYKLRTKAFYTMSDSFNVYVKKTIICLIERKRDSALYYQGKADAYFAAERIVWPK